MENLYENGLPTWEQMVQAFLSIKPCKVQTPNPNAMTLKEAEESWKEAPFVRTSDTSYVREYRKNIEEMMTEVRLNKKI
jgi:hypothetical protein